MKTHYYKEDILEICKNKHLTVEEIFSELSKLYPEAWHKHIHLIDKNTWEIFDLDESLKILNLPKNFIVSDMDIKIFWEFKK